MFASKGRLHGVSLKWKCFYVSNTLAYYKKIFFDIIPSRLLTITNLSLILNVLGPYS